MIFKLSKKGLLPFKKYNINQKYIGLISIKDLNEILKANNSLLTNIFKKDNYYSILEKEDKYYVGILNIQSVNDIGKKGVKVGIILSNKLFIVITIGSSTKLKGLFEQCLDDVSSDFTPEHYFSSFIKIIIDNSFNKLEYVENKIVNIEKELFEKEVYENLNHVIFNIKRELIDLKRYYEYLISFMSIITHHKDYPFLNHSITLLGQLTKQSDYLIQNTIHLREIYQSYLDYYQNRVIKILTVLTAIFLPLTLITSWHGMNLKYMPEINYKYTYPAIIVVCFIFIILFIFILKKKKII